MSNIAHGATSAVIARMPSPSIWADCPVLQILADPAKGVHLFDDFKNSVGTALATDTAQLCGDINWLTISETDDADDLVLKADDSGILKLECGAGSDQDIHAITTGNNTAGIIRTPKKGERKKFWFEARINVSTITTGDIGVFVGLAQPGQMADGAGVFGGDAAALDAVDYLGFAILEGDGDDVTIVYNEAGAGAAQSDSGEIAVSAADVWMRLGLRLDIDTDKIHVYLDGADAEIDISTINFPSDTDMDVILVLAAGTSVADADHLEIDWVRVAQEY